MVRARYRLLIILTVPVGIVTGLAAFGALYLGRGTSVSYSFDEIMRIALAFCAVAAGVSVVEAVCGLFAIRLADKSLTRTPLLRTVVGAAGGTVGVLGVSIAVDLIFSTFFTNAHEPSIGLTTFAGMAAAAVAGVAAFIGFGLSELRAARSE